jgi:diguanylate cyclase (GGDEF)-like protein/PAS domain S-box-containing protein
MTQSSVQPRVGDKIIPLGILIVIAYWLLESFIDSYLFHSSPSFHDALFPQNGELWMRIAVVGLILAFSAYAHVTVVRYRSLEGLCRIDEHTRESLLNATTEAAMLLSLDGTIQALNEKAAKDFGALVPDIVGKNLYDLMSSNVAPRRRQRQQTVIKTGRPLRVEEQQDGRWFDINIYPVTDAGGRVVQCAVFGREITENKKMEQELTRLSITDDLTGLFNQRRFFETIDQEVDRAKRMGYPLCLSILDLDGFKVYNDTYGHLKGNEILRGIGEIIRSSVRKDVDSAYRFGGDEFALILPYADKNTALEIVERIGQRAVRDLDGVMISFGIAPLTDGTTARELVHSADKLMYEHKGQSRNLRVPDNERRS